MISYPEHQSLNLEYENPNYGIMWYNIVMDNQDKELGFLVLYQDIWLRKQCMV